MTTAPPPPNSTAATGLTIGEAAPSTSLLFYQTDDGATQIQVRLHERNVWMTQRALAELYEVTVPNINSHLGNLYEEGEVVGEATIRKFLIVQIEGSRQVTRLVDHYNLQAILAVGYRVRSSRGAQFRRWATTQLEELIVKGFVMDDARIKEGRTLGDDYFDELLARIRDIRASERLFYQKITDIYAKCSVDYAVGSEVTKRFYKTVQNKLHWAIHGHTAAEVIRARAHADLPNMGLKTWKNGPAGAIRKADVSVAKNYLSEEELQSLNRVVGMYLDYAEDQASRKRPMTMKEWEEKLDGFLAFNDRKVLKNAGQVSAEVAKSLAETEFTKFQEQIRVKEALESTSDFDRLVDSSQRLGKKT